MARRPSVSILTKSLKFVLLATIINSLFAFVVFNNCKIRHGWSQSRTYCRLGYTDIQQLFIDRGLINHIFPYSSKTNSFEYPPIMGIGNWIISYFVPTFDARQWFFVFNVLIIIILFLISSFYLWKLSPKNAYLYALSPAVILTLFTNWDMWVVVPALLAIYFFDKNQLDLSAFWLGFSIATKFFPIVFLVPVAVIMFRQGKIRLLFRYSFFTLLFWLALNLPLILTNFEGWARFFTLNQRRGVDLGSIYFALSELGIEIPSLNSLYEFLSIIFFLTLISLILKIGTIPTLSQVAFFSVYVFTILSKVYSPQYILWLTALACIAMPSKGLRGRYWFWQLSELIYYLILQVFLAVTENLNHNPINLLYASSIFFRVIAISSFTEALMREKFQSAEMK